MVIVEIKVDDLAKTVAAKLNHYEKEVMEEIQTVTDMVTKEGVKTLKKTSPKRKGLYAKSWRTKKAERLRRTTENTVFNKNYYQLTHLLEKGHVGRDGKRVKSIPHIAIVEKDMVKQFEEGVERSIKGEV